jgi:ribosome biogenesis GTPase A
MAKNFKDIINTKNVDMYIEVLDARAINISSNPNLISTKKPILKIALKADLAEKNNHKIPNLLIGSINDRNFKQQIISKIFLLLDDKIKSLKNKGLTKPTFHIMVVGLPNVGKSTLINFLSSSHKLKTGNLPGLTRKKTLQKINDNFYLYDTPGILMKNIINEADGYKLALIGAIKREVLPLSDLVEFIYNFFMKNYHSCFSKYFDIKQDNYLAFLEGVANKFNFITKQNNYDLNRTLNFIFDEIMNGRVCKVNYEE